MTYFDEIHCDLDGVLANWVQGIIDHYGLNITHEEVTAWGCLPDLYLETFKGLNINDFWTGIDGIWEDLELYDNAPRILDALKPYPHMFNTSPSWTGAGGKQRWIRKNLPGVIEEGNYVLCPKKHRIARPGALLIDDSPSNVELWIRKGGIGLLYPQPWNDFGADAQETFIICLPKWLEDNYHPQTP